MSLPLVRFRPPPTRTAAREAACGLIRRPGRAGEAELYVRLLRDRDAMRPTGFEEMLAEFLQREFLAPRGHGRPAREEQGWFREVDARVQEREINRRVDLLRRAALRLGCRAFHRVALERVARETGLGVKRLEDIWRRRREKYPSENPVSYRSKRAAPRS